ncbi:MAG TPA: hypothetical protein VGD84_25095, partial [Pseudonocardiaceae bacterium]
DPGNLVEVARALIDSSTIVTVTTELGADRVVISVRRRPHTDDLVWRVALADGVDPTDPDVAKRIDAALAEISADLGLPHAVSGGDR